MEEFISKFNEQLIEPQELNPETSFRDLDDWDSLTAMAVRTMVEDDYNIKISDKEFQSLITIRDLFEFIQTKNN